jgi:hypothetical protein
MPGPTIVAIFAFGVQPTGMKNAVTRPHAMMAAMLGMIMFDKKVPNFWTWTRTEVRFSGGAVAVTMLVLSESAARSRAAGDHRHESVNAFVSGCSCLRQGHEAN